MTQEDTLSSLNLVLYPQISVLLMGIICDLSQYSQAVKIETFKKWRY